MNSTAPTPLTGRLTFIWATGFILVALDFVTDEDWGGQLAIAGFFYFFFAQAIGRSVNQNFAEMGCWIDRQVATPQTGLIGHVNAE